MNKQSCGGGASSPATATPTQIRLRPKGADGESARKQFLLRGASSPPKKLPRTRRTRRRVRIKRERACGPSPALPGQERRTAAKPLSTPRLPRSGQPPPPPKQRRLSAAKPISTPRPPRSGQPLPPPNNGDDTPQSANRPRARRAAASPCRHRPLAERRRFKG